MALLALSTYSDDIHAHSLKERDWREESLAWSEFREEGPTSGKGVAAREKTYLQV